MKQLLEKIFDIAGEILAVLLVVLYALLIINANFDFLPVDLANVFKVVLYYGMLLLVAVVGLEAMVKRNIVFLIIFCLFLALIVIFLFFPDTYANFMNIFSK